MPVDPGKREQWLEYMVREHKEDADQILMKMHGPKLKIPFMSPMLTWATTGGVPVGHMCRWYGPEHSGKSLTNWGLIAAAQNLPEVLSQWYEVDIKFLEKRKKNLAAKKVKKELADAIARFPNGMDSIIFDTEQRADRDFAARIGVDNSRLEIVNNNVIEEIIKDATAASEAFHILIIDSATNGQSVAEANLQPGDYERGTAAQAWKRLRHLRRQWDLNENILILVDQVRTQLGQTNGKGGTPVSPPNVRFIRHNSSLSISFDVGKKLYLDKNLQMTDDYDKASTNIKSLGTNGKESHGIEMRCRVDKNSSGRPFRNARMRFRFPVADIRTGELIQDVGFDTAFEMVEIATHFDIMEKSGSRWYPLDEDFEPIPNPKNKGKTNISYHGEAAAAAAIEEDEEMQIRILERLRRDMK